mmetsp:Transcript_7892/g.20367  ORF Transcript_7892/g.20367 Transcript_7892/m.20367 type:complete len:292 (+) Transcript_7892:656-1531(+)
MPRHLVPRLRGRPARLRGGAQRQDALRGRTLDSSRKRLAGVAGGGGEVWGDGARPCDRGVRQPEAQDDALLHDAAAPVQRALLPQGGRRHIFPAGPHPVRRHAVGRQRRGLHRVQAPRRHHVCRTHGAVLRPARPHGARPEVLSVYGGPGLRGVPLGGAPAGQHPRARAALLGRRRRLLRRLVPGAKRAALGRQPAVRQQLQRHQPRRLLGHFALQRRVSARDLAAAPAPRRLRHQPPHPARQAPAAGEQPVVRRLAGEVPHDKEGGSRSQGMPEGRPQETASIKALAAAA